MVSSKVLRFGTIAAVAVANFAAAFRRFADIEFSRSGGAVSLQFEPVL